MAQPLTDIDAIAEAKRLERLRRARLPIVEKMRLVVEMQKRLEPIARRRGETIHVWRLDTGR